MHQEIVRILYQVANKRPISDEDKKLLEQWIAQSEHNRNLYDEVLDAESLRRDVKSSLDYDSKPLWKKVSKKLFPRKNDFALFRNPFLRYASAAAILILVTAGYFLFFNNPPKEIASVKNTETKLKDDIGPGTDKAKLTLADGSTIILDNSRTGVIIHQEGTTATNQGAQLAYATSQPALIHDVSYHTLSTPRGGQYQLLLPDGSKVFLNAASSIRFPTAFTGNERKVEITGEAYFEVTKEKSKPFKIKINTSKENAGEIEVLGTSFNVNAYSDEPNIKTTLIEGAVKVSAGGKNSLLKPGQQLYLAENGEMKTLNEVNLEAITAWKDKTFYFASEDLKTIMRQLARWYDVEILYEGDITNRTFSGMVNRNRNLSEVLEMLELSNIHFRVQGKQITVLQ